MPSLAQVFANAQVTAFTAFRLDIGNGGSDLDNGMKYGGKNSPPNRNLLGQAEKMDPGAFLLVNWDNDDSDKDCVLDLHKQDVEHEDNLALLSLMVEPMPSSGVLELTLLVGAEKKIKLWKESTKKEEVKKLTWDLSKGTAEETPPKQIWIEGFEPSDRERDVALSLKYGNKWKDAVRVTVVMIRLANAVYRDASIPIPGYASRFHVGLVSSFDGACIREDLADDKKFGITDSAPVVGQVAAGMKLNTLDDFTSRSGRPARGCYSNTTLVCRALSSAWKCW